MSSEYTKTAFGRLLLGAVTILGVLCAAPAQAAAPGITGPTFNLTAQPAHISQPDGASI